MRISLSLSPLPPFVGLKIDIPAERLLLGRLKETPRELTTTAVRSILQSIIDDQYTDGDAAGAWSRRYPAYLREVYGESIPADVSVRDSITCSALIALPLRNFAVATQFQEFSSAIGQRLQAYTNYLVAHFNREDGGFGLRSRPTSEGTSKIVVDLRHTAWGLLSLAELAGNDPNTSSLLRRSGSFVHEHLERLHASDERAVTYATIHAVLTSEVTGPLVFPVVSARRAAIKRLESRIIEGYNRALGSWDMHLDPPATTAVRNSLYILRCIPSAACVDLECREVLGSALQRLYDKTTQSGLPFYHGSTPDAGATCSLAYFMAREMNEFDIDQKHVRKMLQTAVRAASDADAVQQSYPWLLASLLLLPSDSRQERV